MNTSWVTGVIRNDIVSYWSYLKFAWGRSCNSLFLNTNACVLRFYHLPLLMHEICMDSDWHALSEACSYPQLLKSTFKLWKGPCVCQPGDGLSEETVSSRKCQLFVQKRRWHDYGMFLPCVLLLDMKSGLEMHFENILTLKFEILHSWCWGLAYLMFKLWRNI